VVLPVEDMAPEQREVLRSLLLQAKAKERAMSQPQVNRGHGGDGHALHHDWHRKPQNKVRPVLL
jgi:hypothetical protein